MTNIENMLMELGLFIILGVLYYFYQKRKIVHYEENKAPLVMGLILQSCLAEKTDEKQAELDSLIEALDDFLQQKTSQPPLSLLKSFMLTTECSAELKDVIQEALLELGSGDGKK